MSSRRVTFEDFVERSNKIHNNKYDYSKVDWINTRNLQTSYYCLD